MGTCGYHLRCSNYGSKCSECRQLMGGGVKDYLDDRLVAWPKDKEAHSQQTGLAHETEGKVVNG